MVKNTDGGGTKWKELVKSKERCNDAYQHVKSA